MKMGVEDLNSSGMTCQVSAKHTPLDRINTSLLVHDAAFSKNRNKVEITAMTTVATPSLIGVTVIFAHSPSLPPENYLLCKGKQSIHAAHGSAHLTI